MLACRGTQPPERGQATATRADLQRAILACADIAIQSSGLRTADVIASVAHTCSDPVQAQLAEANSTLKERQDEITTLRTQLQSRTDAVQAAAVRADHLQKALDRARADAEQTREAVRAAEAKAASERSAAESQRRRTKDSHDDELAAVRADSAANMRRTTEKYEARLSDVGQRLDGITEHAQVRPCPSAPVPLQRSRACVRPGTCGAEQHGTCCRPLHRLVCAGTWLFTNM